MIRLKDLLKEETFTATNKQSGKTSVFKSKDSRDAAIKAGTHAAIKDKSQPSQPKAAGSDLFGGDYAKDRGGKTSKDAKTTSASKAVIKGGKWQPNPETANDETKIKLDMGWDTDSERENKQAQAAFKKYNISVKPLKRLPSGEIEYEVNGKKKDILAYIQSSNYEMDTDDVKDYYSDLLK
jgi:hypothetical protein